MKITEQITLMINVIDDLNQECNALHDAISTYEIDNEIPGRSATFNLYDAKQELSHARHYMMRVAVDLNDNIKAAKAENNE